MPTLAEIRASLGPEGASFTDEQLYNAAMTAFAPLYSNPKVLQSQLGYDPNRDFARGGEIALRGTGAALAWPLVNNAAALLSDVPEGEEPGPTLPQDLDDGSQPQLF